MVYGVVKLYIGMCSIENIEGFAQKIQGLIKLSKNQLFFSV